MLPTVFSVDHGYVLGLGHEGNLKAEYRKMKSQQPRTDVTGLLTDSVLDISLYGNVI